VFAVPAAGTYGPPQTLLDLSRPLGGEGKATWIGEERRERKEREREDKEKEKWP